MLCHKMVECEAEVILMDDGPKSKLHRIIDDMTTDEARKLIEYIISSSSDAEERFPRRVIKDPAHRHRPSGQRADGDNP